MTIISFKVSNPNEATKLYSMLQAYGVEDLCVDNKKFLEYLIKSLEKNLQQTENNKLIDNKIVQKQILDFTKNNHK